MAISQEARKQRIIQVREQEREFSRNRRKAFAIKQKLEQAQAERQKYLEWEQEQRKKEESAVATLKARLELLGAAHNAALEEEAENAKRELAIKLQQRKSQEQAKSRFESAMHWKRNEDAIRQKLEQQRQHTIEAVRHLERQRAQQVAARARLGANNRDEAEARSSSYSDDDDGRETIATSPSSGCDLRKFAKSHFHAKLSDERGVSTHSEDVLEVGGAAILAPSTNCGTQSAINSAVNSSKTQCEVEGDDEGNNTGQEKKMQAEKQRLRRGAAAMRKLRLKKAREDMLEQLERARRMQLQKRQQSVVMTAQRNARSKILQERQREEAFERLLLHGDSSRNSSGEGDDVLPRAGPPSSHDDAQSLTTSTWERSPSLPTATSSSPSSALCLDLSDDEATTAASKSSTAVYSQLWSTAETYSITSGGTRISKSGSSSRKRLPITDFEKAKNEGAEQREMLADRVPSGTHRRPAITAVSSAKDPSQQQSGQRDRTPDYPVRTVRFSTVPSTPRLLGDGTSGWQVIDTRASTMSPPKSPSPLRAIQRRTTSSAERSAATSDGRRIHSRSQEKTEDTDRYNHHGPLDVWYTPVHDSPPDSPSESPEANNGFVASTKPPSQKTGISWSDSDWRAFFFGPL